MANTAANGLEAPGNTADSTFSNLTIDGTSLGDQVAPDTRISLPGVEDVILNERMVSGDGTSSGQITVNMIHVLLKDSLTGVTTGEIIVGSATSEASNTE